MIKSMELRETMMKQKMYDLAVTAREKAYAPYSNFAVGVCILTKNNNFYQGCNVENAAYPMGICAEAGAIANMIVCGDNTIAKILIIATGEVLCTPCGGCRQKIMEFANPATLIHIAHSKGIRKTFTMQELLPYSFSKLNLK